MGKLVEALRLGYYGNKRIKPGEQFVMEDAMFKKPVLDDEGKVIAGKFEKEEVAPSWVAVVEDGYEDPVFKREKDISHKPKKKLAKKVEAKADDDHEHQGGAFHVDTESGIQITGQVAPAKPAVSSVAPSLEAAGQDSVVDEKSQPKAKAKKGSGDKEVI